MSVTTITTFYDAPRIAENGWRPVPLKAKSKVPAVSDWPNFKLSVGDELTYVGCSVGLLLGHGVIAVDVDVRDPEAVERIETLAERMLGHGLKRVGAAPKFALLYRTATELPYVATCRYRFSGDAAGAKAHRVEVLTDGKQLAAFGVHPETGKPYQWNGSGSPLDRRVDELPLVDGEKISEFLHAAEGVLTELGQRIETRQLGPDSGEHSTSELGQRARDPAQFRDALRNLPNDYSRESWIKLAHSIKAGLGAEGWPDFEAWCRKSPSYTGRDTRRVWESLNPTAASAGTLLREARLRGWKPKERIEPAAGGAAGGDDGESWVPPPVVTYGANFNPAQIPLRRWLLGQRRSVGELTVDVGPPGVNKSMLMLTDAVAIVTGRALLADPVHETGEVLLLAGEDARRDIEARLAGILTYYQVSAAELADRLHVVYLAEVDANAYSIAQMERDVALLNRNMCAWLRERPGIVAVFVDPLMAWHALPENNNPALQLLFSSLRAVAVQGERHVGIDHHVTKIAMSDPEAHVGNLAAIRGAGAIGASARWAFTMSRLNLTTAQTFGLTEVERKRYRRLDALKASYGEDDVAVRLLRVESVPIANGESVGVLVEQNVEQAHEQAKASASAKAERTRELLADALAQMLAEHRPRSANSAAEWLTGRYAQLLLSAKGEPLSLFSVRRRLPVLIGRGLRVSVDGRPRVIVYREPPQKGHGAVVDFSE